MKYHMLAYLFLCPIFLSSPVSPCLDDERAALLTFKSFLLDPSHRLSSWHGKNCCDWEGILCSISRHVVAVNLRNPNPEDFIRNMNSELVPISNSTSTAIKGSISPSLFSLGHVRYLDLSFNDFMLSNIPIELSNLTRLTYLNLSNAMLRDTITTQFSNLTSLTWLDVSSSTQIADISSYSFNLTTSPRVNFGSMSSYIYGGHISSSNLDWVQGLHNLRDLRLSGVDLSKASQSSRWVEPISRLQNLKILHLSNCSILGKFPTDQLLNLTHLHSLRMDFNLLTSSIPNKLANLSSLSVLDVTSSNIQGLLPPFPQLKELYIGDNPGITVDLNSMFSIPWPHLERIDIEATQVLGSIPPSLANTTTLISFIANNCSIKGPLPSSITRLSRLESLQLNINELTGQLPPSISNLKSLKFLSLYENSLEGTIPASICDLSSLQYLVLTNNLLSGSLPDCIGKLPNLFIMSFSLNRLNGTISSFAQFLGKNDKSMVGMSYNELTVKVDQSPFPSNFQPLELDLASCNMSGGIPNFISNLTQLVFLSLAENSLSGRIPSWLFKLPKLCYLDLSSNNLHGSLPPSIQLHSSFWGTTLNLASNSLEGPIPEDFQNIEVIDLSGNDFTGHIPEQIGGVHKIIYLSFANNKLFGQIPSSFCHQISSLMLLDLSANILSGTVPNSLGSCTSLSVLNLGLNNFTGNLPNELGLVENFIYLDIRGNSFHGPFPNFIDRFRNMEFLNLANNRFEGRIPQFIGHLQNLRILVLKSNHFNESIPKEINKLGKLQFLDLSYNELSGYIPQKLDGLRMMKRQSTEAAMLGEVISLMFVGYKLEWVSKGLLQQLGAAYDYHTGMVLSCNKLIGNIPLEIGLLQGLYMLNLSHNDLSGNVPEAIGNMSALESLDLSFNQLSGHIPITLKQLDFLSFLNLSFNNLSGEIPEGGHFDTLSESGSAFTGNKFLCGAPGGMNCNHARTTIAETSDDGTDAWNNLYLHGIVTAGYGVGLWGFFSILYFTNEGWRDIYWMAIDKIVFRIIQCFEGG